jgi:hypothetical protein
MTRNQILKMLTKVNCEDPITNWIWTVRTDGVLHSFFLVCIWTSGYIVLEFLKIADTV